MNNNSIIVGLQRELEDATINAASMREHFMGNMIKEYGIVQAISLSTNWKHNLPPTLKALREGDRAAQVAEQTASNILRHVERFVS